MNTMNAIIYSGLAYYCFKELCDLIKALKQSSDYRKYAEISDK